MMTYRLEEGTIQSLKYFGMFKVIVELNLCGSVGIFDSRDVRVMCLFIYLFYRNLTYVVIY